ncbi:MAG: barstar family protein [Alphaproteobacteria bacterium]|nr:barstar family protein [Alphaproteobacteria bacterium]MCB9975238.1 barstar family protein [Rhodospirillales bacterium]
MAWDVVQINCDAIVDERSFHEEFAQAFGFPDQYDYTTVSWLKLLSQLDNAEKRLTAVYCEPNEVITIELLNVAAFAARCPEQMTLCIEGVAYINWARIEQDLKPVLALAFYGQQYYDLSDF